MANQEANSPETFLSFLITGISGFSLKRGVFFNPDPYVKLRILPGTNCRKCPHHKQLHHTKQVEGTTNPTWKEQFYVQVLRSDIIELEVRDRFDRGHPTFRRFLGKLDVPVTEILERLNCREQRYTGPLVKRGPLDQTSGSLSFLVSDGRSSLFNSVSFNSINNGYNHRNRNSVASSESSLTSPSRFHENSLNGDLSEALDNCMPEDEPPIITNREGINIICEDSGLENGDSPVVSTNLAVEDFSANQSASLPNDDVNSAVTESASLPPDCSENGSGLNLEPNGGVCSSDCNPEPPTTSLSSGDGTALPFLGTDIENIARKPDFEPSPLHGAQVALGSNDLSTSGNTGAELVVAVDQEPIVVAKSLRQDLEPDQSLPNQEVLTTEQPLPCTHQNPSQPCTQKICITRDDAKSSGSSLVDGADTTGTGGSPGQHPLPKLRHDKDTLLNLLKFIALSDSTGENEPEPEREMIDILIIRPSASSHVGCNIIGGSESKHPILRSMGIYVTKVEAGSPAALAGVKVHDRLVLVDGEPVIDSHSAVVNALNAAAADVLIKVERRSIPPELQEPPPSSGRTTRRRPSLPISLVSKKRSMNVLSTSSSYASGIVLHGYPSRPSGDPLLVGGRRREVLFDRERTVARAIRKSSMLADNVLRGHPLRSRSYSGNVDSSPSQEGLPQNWEACVDRHGREFYLDHVNRITQWERPKMASVAQPSSPIPATQEEQQPTTSRPPLRRIGATRGRLKRFNSVKGDRNYQQVMRRYQSIRRVTKPDITVAPGNSNGTSRLQTKEGSAEDLGEETEQEVASASGANDSVPAEVPPADPSEVEAVVNGNEDVVDGPAPSTSQTNKAVTSSPTDDEESTSRHAKLKDNPAYRFLSHPQFFTLLSSNREAFEMYAQRSVVKYMVTKITRDRSIFHEYQHNKDLVKFINCFSDPAKALPNGWEMKTDNCDKPFFIDHNNRSTTFFDPRLPYDDETPTTEHPSPLRSSIATDSGTSPTTSSIQETDEDESRLPVQSPLVTTAPQVVPRPHSTLSHRSRPIDEPQVAPVGSAAPEPRPQAPSSRSPQAAPADQEVTYNDRVVAFLKQPNVVDILRERFTAIGTSQSLQDKVMAVRTDGLSALERYTNSLQLNMMLSMFEEEIMNFVVVRNDRARAVLAERPSLSPTASPVATRSRAVGRLHRNFDSKLRGFYRKLEQKGYGQGPGKIKLVVNRDNLLEDAFRKVMTIPRKDLQRSKLFISFAGEEGLDYSGPSREFFFLLSRELFNPYYGLFEYSAVDTYTVQISPMSMFVDSSIEWFRFAGRIIGLCLVHHCLLDAFFTRPLYKMLLRSKCDLSDLRYVDEQFYQSMVWMKENDITDVLDLTFTVDEEMFGKIKEKELKPNGRNIPVTEKNKKDYIDRMVKWRVIRGTIDQTNRLVRGFNEVIDLRLLNVFDAHELELVICGTADIDLKDWRQHTEYRGGYFDLHPVITWFWEALERFDNERRLRLLQFVTGTSSVPYEGFAALRGPNGPKRFCIEKWGKVHCLPRAHTCFNRIDLPPYTSFNVLWEKIVIAVEETSTFGLE